MNWKEQPPHEIRIAAEKGKKMAQKELERRKQNRRGMLVPYWEKEN